MASDARNTAAAINAAISSADYGHASPEQSRWKIYWARYWCFRSQKREKRIVPAARSDGASGPAGAWPPAQAGLALAPPSSPASFVNSSVQSPASFTLSLSAASASMASPGPINTMFTIGPYAHETQLVSPPVFSTFTTEPSTAPLTPPPELAHLTTPSSPDVPFAQLIASSLEAKATARGSISPLSTSNLASPCDTPVSYAPSSGQLYLGSPVDHLLSPASRYLGSETSPNMQVFGTQSTTSSGKNGSSFPAFEPFVCSTFDSVPFGALISNSASSSLEGHDASSNVDVELDLTNSSNKGNMAIKAFPFDNGDDVATEVKSFNEDNVAHKALSLGNGEDYLLNFAGTAKRSEAGTVHGEESSVTAERCDSCSKAAVEVDCNLDHTKTVAKDYVATKAMWLGKGKDHSLNTTSDQKQVAESGVCEQEKFSLQAKDGFCTNEYTSKITEAIADLNGRSTLMKDHVGPGALPLENGKHYS